MTHAYMLRHAKSTCKFCRYPLKRQGLHRQVVQSYIHVSHVFLSMPCQPRVCAGNSSLAGDILSNKFKEIAPIFGSKIEGRDKFKSTIDGLFSVSLAAFQVC